MSNTKEEKKEKCFVIMPISDQGDYLPGHFTKVYEQIIKPSIEEAGYEAYRVDENNICDAIINKIFNAIQECPMAICDLSNRNPNVLYELGLRQAYDKPVVLIQDDKTEKIFDVSGISTVFYKSARLYEDVIEARENIKKAILSTKEGKINTLAKIIKVNSADFSKIEVSQEDQTNVILKGIYDAIKEIKNKEQVNYSHPTETRLGKNVTLSHDWDTVTRNEYSGICLAFKYFNNMELDLFKMRISNEIAELKETKIKPIEDVDNLYNLYFYFDRKVNADKMLKLIRRIAMSCNIEVSNEYYFFEW